MKDIVLVNNDTLNHEEGFEIKKHHRLKTSTVFSSGKSLPVFVCSHTVPFKIEELKDDIECIVVITKGNRSDLPVLISPEKIPAEVWIQIQKALVTAENKPLKIQPPIHDPLEIIHEMGVLTQREKEILGLLCDGLLYKEIAEELGISALTVKNHLRNIYPKLKVANRSEAIVKYLGHYSQTCHCREKFRL